MSDEETPTPDSAADAAPLPVTHLTDQIVDAVSQVNACLSGLEASTLQGAACLAFVHTMTLAMQNAVAAQRREICLSQRLACDGLGHKTHHCFADSA